MLFDLKYHLVSLVAVFLALAVGIVVGSSFIAGSSVKGLEKEFIKLRADNRQQQKTIEDMRLQVDRHREFERAFAPLLANKQLSWRRVAIIQTGDYSEATQSAKTILEAAGARVASVTTFSNIDSKFAQERVIRAVEVIAGETPTEPTGQLIQIVANSIATGSNPEALDILEKKGLLTASGEYNGKVLRVVLIGGSRFKGSLRAAHVDLPLIDALRSAGVVTIVGAEPLNAVTSYISAYHRKAIPTVDNVDMPMGQVALVYAMAGETGNFGVKRSADRVAPDYVESGQWRTGSQR